MMSLEEMERAIASLPQAEKARLLERLTREVRSPGDLTPGIRMTPGVVGGAACIRNTRIAVWMLEQARRLGVSEADLLLNYPGLTALDLTAAWSYVGTHQAEIEAAIAVQENDE